MADAPFFVSGGTLPLSAGSYVERAADRDLFEALSRGRYAYVLNARQMGKSSLCVRTIARLEAAGVRTAFVDLTRIGGRNVTPDQWYIGLLGEIGRGIGGRAEMVRFWKENPDVSPMQRFFGALAAYALPEGAPPIVVFVDEVDATRSLPFSADEFFGGIRECFNRRAHDPAFERLTFCLLGAAIPSDLIRDMEASPFNVGERIPIRDFTKEEVMAFAVGLEAPLPRVARHGGGAGGGGAQRASGSSWRGGQGGEGMALVARVFHWTAGHPFLTQSLCARLAEEPSPLGEGRVGVSDVDRLVEADLFAPSARESNVNLADVGNRVLLSSDGEDPDRHRAEILALYSRILKGKRVEDDESSPRVAILKLSGLVAPENGLLKVRNRIYARVFGPAWIAEHMPDGEARRVRRAYRVGLLRAATAGAALLAVVGALGASAAVNARNAERARDRALVAERAANDEKTRAEGLAARLQGALDDATRDRETAVRAGKAATASALSERAAKGEAQAAAARAVMAKGEAQRSAVAALTAGARERVAAGKARESAAEAVESAGEARREALIAQGATRKANAERDRAERLLYTSNLQLVSDALLQGSGVRAATLLAETRSPDGRPSWAERHYRAVLREDALYPGHVGRVGHVAFAPNGDVLTLDGYEVEDTGVATPVRGHGTLRRWSRRTGRLDGTLDVRNLPGAVSMDLSSDGKAAIIAFANGSLRRYATDDFRLLGTARGTGTLIGNVQATLQPDRVLAWQAMSQVALSLTDATPPETLETHTGNAALDGLRTVLLPDGDLLRTSVESRYRLARYHPLPGGGYRLRWLVGTASIHAIAVSPDARLIAYASNENATLVEATTGIVRPKPVEHPATVYALAFSHDGKTLATGSDDGTVKLTDVESGRTLQTLAIRHPEITSIAFSPDGATLALGSGDGTAELRSLDRAAGPAGALPLASVNGVAASRAGLLLAGGSGRSLNVTDPKTGKVRFSFKLDTETWGSGISPDGRTVAVVEQNGRYRAWDAKTGKLLCDVPHLLDSSTSLKSLTLGNRGLALAYVGGVGSWNGYLDTSGFALVDARTGRLVAPRRDEIGYFTAGRFAPDGARFALARQIGSATVYDAKTALPLFDLPDPRGDRAACLVYSPDGSLIAVGRRSGWIDLYDAGNGRALRSWPAHSGRLYGMALSNDGRTLVSLGEDKTRRTWDVATGRSVGVEAVANPGGDIWFGAGDESVYFADGGQVQARRVGGDLAPIPPARRLPEWPDPRVVMREAEARARRSGRPILLILRDEHDYPSGRVVDPLTENPDVIAILRRRFEVVVESADGVHRTNARTYPNADYWKEKLGALGALQYSSVSILSPDGRTFWGVRRPDGQQDAATWMGIPLESDQVDGFVRVLHRASPAMTTAEAEEVRNVLLRDERRFAEDLRTQAQDADLDRRIQAAQAAKRTDDALALLRERRRERPLDVVLAQSFVNQSVLTQSETDLVRAGRYREAADRIVGPTEAGDPVGFDLLRYAVALYGLADDGAGIQRAYALLPVNLDPASIGFVEGLAPARSEPFAKLLANADAITDPEIRSSPSYMIGRSLLAIRADRPKEAEDAMRKVLVESVDKAPIDANIAAWYHEILALALARQGRLDEARAVLALATQELPATPTAGAFAANDVISASHAVLRHESRGLIGGEDPDAAYARAAELARTGEPKAAADLLVRTMRAWGGDTSQLQFALALYGIAGDRDGARAVRDLVDKSPNPGLLSSLVPGTIDDPAALLTKTPVPKPEDTGARENRAMLMVRAGRYAEVEAEMRSVIRDRAADLASTPVLKRWAHQILSLALAYQGKKDEARAELAAANIYTGDTSDAALLRLGQPGPTTFVLLRREILRLIGKE